MQVRVEWKWKAGSCRRQTGCSTCKFSHQAAIGVHRHLPTTKLGGMWAALEYRARRGEIILLYEDETVVWRFALPRAGWWRTAQRARLPIRPLSQSQMKREESLKRQAWMRSRSWSRVTSGVLLSVIGAVQYGTSKVFYKIVPHFDAQELRQYLHQVMATFSKTGKEVVMVVDRSGIHRAHKLDATLEHYYSKFRFHFLPAHCGHHLNPIEGFWRVMKDAIGAGRCL